jgi:hypothetical protein
MPETLTQAQALAVERRGGPILVSAAAGSGKTKVLVERLMRRVLSTTEECNINDFLIITFTKRQRPSFGRGSQRSLRFVWRRTPKTSICKSSKAGSI